MKVSDPTTIAIILTVLGSLSTLFVWFIKRFFFNAVKNKVDGCVANISEQDDKIQEQDTKLLRLERVADTLEQSKQLSKLEGKVEVLENLLMGFSGVLVEVGKDHLSSLRRDLQKEVREVIKTELEKKDNDGTK